MTVLKYVRRLRLAPWILACTIAELIGMTAAATAARLGLTLPGQPWTALALVVVGGLIEGAALGVLQGSVLSRSMPGLSRARWFLVTTAVAGIGWAAASASGVLSDQPSDTSAPPLWAVLIGAAALGLVMGGLLALAQLGGFRGRVRYPRRWIGISAAAWAPAMAIIFFGATTPDASWGTGSVVVAGAATGIFAGAVLGTVSGILFPLLDGGSVGNLTVAALLRSPARRLLGSRGVALIRVRGVVSGRVLELPVQFATVGDRILIVPAHSSAKRWWRNFIGSAPGAIVIDGRWKSATGTVLSSGDPRYAASADAYRARWTREIKPTDPVVVLILDQERSAA
ncbi:hypothetical protein BH09ACT4_BH09ACT4_07780 [soil metagenome]